MGKTSESLKTTWALPHWIKETQYFSYEEVLLGNQFTSVSVKNRWVLVKKQNYSILA